MLEAKEVPSRVTIRVWLDLRAAVERDQRSRLSGEDIREESGPAVKVNLHGELQFDRFILFKYPTARAKQLGLQLL